MLRYRGRIAAAVAATIAAFIGAVCAPCGAQQSATIETALAKLHSSDHAVRSEGQRTLTAVGRPAIADLMRTLADEESRVRQAAAGALVGIGRPAVRPLLRGLENGSVNCRRGSARALVIMLCGSHSAPSSTDAADALFRLAQRGTASVRQRAISILGQAAAAPQWCSPSVWAKARDALLGALDDDDVDVRWHAAHALGKTSVAGPRPQHERVAQELQLLLTSPSPKLRGAAAWALHRADATAGSMDLDAEATVSCLALSLSEGSLDITPAASEQIAKRGAAIAEAILALLADDVAWEDARTSIAALRSIGPAARDPLLAALNSPDAAIREVGAAALSEAAARADTDVVEALRAALSAEDGSVRLAAATTIGAAMGELTPLVRLLGDRYDYVRAGAAEALVEQGRAAVGALVGALSEANPRTRRLAALALGRIGEERAVRPLMKLMGDPDVTVRTGAVAALGRIKSTSAVDALIGALQDADLEVRRQAAVALGAIGDARAVEPLIDALRDPVPGVRTAAVHALGAVGSPGAMEALLMAMHRESGICDPLDAAEALGQMGAAAVRPLMPLLRDEDAVVRLAAIHALGATGAVQGASALVALLGDTDPRICAAAGTALLQFRGTPDEAEAVRALTGGLSAESGHVRARSAALLGQMGNPDAAAALARALRDSLPAVRAGAARALGDLRAVDAVADLAAALEDDSYDVRRAAAVTLQRIRTPAALGALRNAAGPPAT